MKAMNKRQQLWFDNDTAKYHLIEEKTVKLLTDDGEEDPNQDAARLAKDQFVRTSAIYQNGSKLRVHSTETTGKVSFNKRKELAHKSGGVPYNAVVPEFVARANKKLYTPQNDKFDGYT